MMRPNRMFLAYAVFSASLTVAMGIFVAWMATSQQPWWVFAAGVLGLLRGVVATADGYAWMKHGRAAAPEIAKTGTVLTWAALLVITYGFLLRAGFADVR